LIEITVALVVILVAIIGAMAYRYYSILDARKARVHITGARVGSTLLENWKGTGGRSEPGDEFDPRYVGFGTNMVLAGSSAAGPICPSGFQQFGKYAVVVDGATYYAGLFYQDDLANDLRVLNVVVGWPHKYPSGGYTSTDQTAALQSVRLTSKVLIPDES
jgi:hypothetical protein